MKKDRATTFANALDPYMPEPSKRFYSVGALCQFFQIVPGQLRVLMESANVRFAEVRDSVPYLDGDGFNAVAVEYERISREIEAVRDSAQSN